MQKYAVLFVILAAALWGVDGIVLRPALYTLPVSLVVFIETAAAALFLSPFFVKNLSTLKKLGKTDWMSFFAVAVFGGAIGTMAITKALFYVGYVNLSIVVLIQKLQPVFAISLAAVLLKERLPKIFFIWAFLAVIGAVIMVFGFTVPDMNTGDKTLPAVFFAFIATVSFAMSTVFSKRALKNVDYKMGTYLRFVLTALVMLIVSILLMDIQKIGTVNASQWLIFLLIVFSAGGPALFLYYFGLMRISASVAAIGELAFPLTAIVLEYFVHDKILSVPQWIGVLILVYSIFQVSKFHLKKEKVEN